MKLPARRTDPFDDSVEEAFRSEPLDEAPPSLASRVMARVRASSTASPAARGFTRPRFRLTWLDYTLSLFFAILLGSIPILDGSLPPQLSLYLRLEGQYWLQRISYQPVFPLLMVGGAFLLVGGTLLLGIFSWRLLRAGLPNAS